MSADSTADTIASLARDYHQASCDARPLWAAVFGVPGYDDRLDELSEDAEASHAESIRDIAARTAQIDPSMLSDADRVTRAVLLHEAQARIDYYEDNHTELALSSHASPVCALFQVLPKTPADKVDGLIARLRATPRLLEQFGDRATAATRKGRGPHARGLHNAIDQVATYLALPLSGDPFIQPAEGTAFYEEAYEVVADEVRPAMQRLVDVLSGPVQDGARSDDKCGLVHTPDGADIYRRAVAAHTTTGRTPEEIHQTGLDIVADLREEYAQLGHSVFGISDVGQVMDRLRNDKGLRYASPQEMLNDARASLLRAEQALPGYFGTYHRAKCEVEAMNDLEAPTAVLAYYMPGAPDGSRPGRHWLNTWQPHTRTRYEYETLAYHESVPGHHLQFTVGQELTDIPDFRRFGYVTAFGEGWGLYTERLCDEMGLYSGDLARFGMASFDSWRACRLVVDTGIHFFGWGRQRAIDYMWDNSALTMENIVNEVDRYITWPGQACAYMIGRLEINELRARAKERLGAQFDIRAFHDAVLLNGSVPLAVLRDEVSRTLGL